MWIWFKTLSLSRLVLPQSQRPFQGLAAHARRSHLSALMHDYGSTPFQHDPSGPGSVAICPLHAQLRLQESVARAQASDLTGCDAWQPRRPTGPRKRSVDRPSPSWTRVGQPRRQGVAQDDDACTASCAPSTEEWPCRTPRARAACRVTSPSGLMLRVNGMPHFRCPRPAGRTQTGGWRQGRNGQPWFFFANVQLKISIC